MKLHLLVIVVITGFFLFGCGESLVDTRYKLELPELPATWETMLDRPHWRVEWVNDKGRKEIKIIPERGSLEIDLPPTIASAVSAFPFWPEMGINPGIFKPAGAIFPFDVSGKSLVLSWRGGVDAALYWEFLKVASRTGFEEDTTPPEVDIPLGAERAVVPRLPWNFDWPRFRQLFDDSSLNVEILADPWLADWHSIASKIVQSGFDKRRLVPKARNSLHIPVGQGPWIGTSPFASPLYFETNPVFLVSATADTWISSEGLLRCNTEAWIVIEWER
jgi:hypothetical protein